MPSSPAKPFLSLREATFRLGDRLVFQNASWIFRSDEQWAIMGPNGSGKSLFTDALRGKLPLVRGELLYHFAPDPTVLPEQSIGHVAFGDRKESVHGTIAQSRWNSFEQDPARTVADFLSYGRVMSVNPFEIVNDRAERKGFERRLRQAVELLQVRRFLPRDLLSLSNGETQRVHLARALALPLQLMILDEPFTGLDTASRAFLNKVLERLTGTRLRIIFVTARRQDLPRGFTHCLRIEDCQIQEAKRLEKPSRMNEHVRSTQKHRGTGLSPARTDKASRKTDGEILVRLRNVTVRYGAAVILDHIHWTIRRGESWALLGPNGAGKTTLLSLVLGDNPQVYTNDVTVFGKRRGHGESIWEIKRQIGCVSPELHLHFDDSLTSLEAVLSGFHDTMGLFEPAKRNEKRAAREWLRRFELTDVENAPLFSLSPGLQRMVLLARALVKRPKLLLLDEPCEGLDDQHRDLFLGFLNTLISSGAETAIYVTHRAEEIPPSITRVLRLEDGRVADPFHLTGA
jgi:molybdate transport system ATP-binding protein